MPAAWSHVTRHMSHVTRHMSHVTRHTATWCEPYTRTQQTRVRRQAVAKREQRGRQGATELDLECVKAAAAAVCDLDFVFTLVLGDEPFKRAVAHALHGVRGRGGVRGNWWGVERVGGG